MVISMAKMGQSTYPSISANGCIAIFDFRCRAQSATFLICLKRGNKVHKQFLEAQLKSLFSPSIATRQLKSVVRGLLPRMTYNSIIIVTNQFIYCQLQFFFQKTFLGCFPQALGHVSPTQVLK